MGFHFFGFAFHDQVGLARRSKAVINIDYTDSAGTAVEHGEQGGHPAKVGPIAGAAGHSYDRLITSPPITLARAPSMPATTITTEAFRIRSTL
jgi:hypothetical protein